jgi:glycosyltransferase involved in cell wall biosynthesis
MRLRVAGRVGAEDRDYFRAILRPMFRDPRVEFIGEIGGAEKVAFLSSALALLFPIDWPEPFGLVMIEALACGTPVIAFRRGAVPEVIEPGVSGFVVDTVDEAVAAVEQVKRLDRSGCRGAFEARFLATRMADEYLGIYQDLR